MNKMLGKINGKKRVTLVMCSIDLHIIRLYLFRIILNSKYEFQFLDECKKHNYCKIIKKY